MGLNDGFLDMMACPGCGEKVLMRLQIKIDGADMHDYRPGRQVTSEVLESVRRNESEFINAVRKDFAIPEDDLSEIGLESADGSFVVVGEARCVGRACKCGQLRKKHPDIRPVVIEGNPIVRTWWGKAWNSNLSKYADYANRVGRGRSYLRHGAVLDLQINPGRVSSLVQGSRGNPYKITIEIKPVSRSIWKKIRAACEGQVASLQELLEGRFPKGLAELFTAKGSGLFPSPKEIEFTCSCPDWAYMCKHVAATLYGIGTRLDEDPSLFFVLRKLKMEDLITQAVRDKSARLLKQAKKKTSRVIDDADLGDVFGIELGAAAVENEGHETTIIEPRVAVKARRKAPAKKARKKLTTKRAKTIIKKTKRGSSAKMKK